MASRYLQRCSTVRHRLGIWPMDPQLGSKSIWLEPAQFYAHCYGKCQVFRMLRVSLLFLKHKTFVMAQSNKFIYKNALENGVKTDYIWRKNVGVVWNKILFESKNILACGIIAPKKMTDIQQIWSCLLLTIWTTHFVVFAGKKFSFLQVLKCCT